DDPSSTFDDDNMLQVVMDFFFLAGTETTTTTLSYPSIQGEHKLKVQRLTERELKKETSKSRTTQYVDRSHLPYTNAVIHKIQRNSSVASIGALHQCEDSIVQGFLFRKDDIILTNLTSVLHDSEHWEMPDMLNPNHFLDSDGNFKQNEAFYPFSAGARVCLGEQLAWIELFLFFTHLLQTFTFTLPDGVKDVNLKYVFGNTLCPYPYQICAVPR
uniref:Uncharacterized protein n=1 Tax=Latimeria chalumnae TaxID=7897 RepID=H3B8W8_LATCH